MSNQRRHRRTLQRRTLEAVALASARDHGCTCTPDLQVRHLGDFTHLAVLHDTWCPAHPDHRQETP
ncbi:MAG: hypothetical protein M9906_14245 [Microthrixaceae bacterium]|nr:hypothetical protein [Microthrixaceae bacterium]